MLSRRLPGILPPLAGEEALDVTMIHGIAGLLPPGAGLVAARPFRAPHHCASSAALVGGGRPPRPGEVTLAHHGVLFLDELAEFRRESLEALRTPLEDGRVTVSRLNSAAVFPAAFMLVAAMNPCPCGWLGDPVRPCRCSPDEVERYRGRISGPLLDRIDVVVEVRRPAYAELAQPRTAPNTSSAAVRARVAAARRLQHARASAAGIVAPRPNAALAAREVERLCQPDAAGERLLAAAFDRLGLSPRARERILKVARTIADLDGAQTVGVAHVAEAIQYRALDRGRP
jgi:magnesium chelatase family protein